LKILNANAPDQASLLTAYIDKVTKPRLLKVYGTGGFSPFYGPNTPVSTLDDSLATPNATKVFQVVFSFSKFMDSSSVSNPNNWSISKAVAGEQGGAYNWGQPKSSKDVQIAPTPTNIFFDPGTQSATVSFQITQNAAGNGTIDPSHIDFKFKGTDAYGNAMDASADQYNGISLIA
jgi:hypothetical protein